MVEVILIIILGILVLAQTVERYFFARHMTAQLEKCMKAVMSRNITDYLTATNEPKRDQEFIQTEDIDLSDVSDEEFLKTINKGANEVL